MYIIPIIGGPHPYIAHFLHDMIVMYLFDFRRMIRKYNSNNCEAFNKHMSIVVSCMYRCHVCITYMQYIYINNYDLTASDNCTPIIISHPEYR